MKEIVDDSREYYMFHMVSSATRRSVFAFPVSIPSYQNKTTTPTHTHT